MMPRAVQRRHSNLFSSPEPPKSAKHAQGTHHLLVYLRVKLGWCSGLAVTQFLLLAFLGVLLLLFQQRAGGQDASKLLTTTEQHRLLLATHNRLAWYFPLQDAFQIIHEGQGVHYGMFPGDPLPRHPHTVWNIIRPHNWRPSTAKEFLVQLDADTGAELKRIEVNATHFTHDAIRIGSKVYVCSTGSGSILELSYPNMTLVREMPLFTTKDHPNTLAAVSNDTNHLWVLLHNLGESDLVKVYVGPDSAAHEVSRIKGVGTKAHGLVAWGKELLLLDSDNGALVSLDTATGDVFDLYQVPEEDKFLKGLAVLDDVAYFGITTWAERSMRDSPDQHGDLGAFDLTTNKLLFRRRVPTGGLLNIIGAPHLSVDSTYVATYSSSRSADVMRAGLQGIATPLDITPIVLPDSSAMVRQAVDVLASAGYPPADIGPDEFWSSGWPRLNPAPKLTDTPEDAGLQLPLFHAHVSALQAAVLGLPNEAWTKEYQALHSAVMEGRDDNMQQFKPGVEGIILLFSDNEGKVVYEFPFYQTLRHVLEPVLLEVLGPSDIHNIVRLQLARMPPGTSDIKTHQDSGGYAKHGHRIHVPLKTHPLVSFSVCPDGDANAAAVLQGLAAIAASSTGRAATATANKRTLAAASQIVLEGEHSITSGDSETALNMPTDGRQEQQQHVAVGRTLLMDSSSHEATRHSLPRPEELPPLHLPALASYYAGEEGPAESSIAVEPTGQVTAQHSTPRAAQRHRKKQHQQPPQKQQQQLQLLKEQRQRPCVKLSTPEGLVFELNNRVPHKVSNPLESGTSRVHLVIDVYEHLRVRTPLPPGTRCEYGSMPVRALQQLQNMLAEQASTDAVMDNIRALVASPGMTCVEPGGKRTMPLRKANPSKSEAAELQQQEELVQQLLEQLQAVVGQEQQQRLAAEDGGILLQ